MVSLRVRNMINQDQTDCLFVMITINNLGIMNFGIISSHREHYHGNFQLLLIVYLSVEWLQTLKLIT